MYLVLLIIFSLPGPCAWADSGKDRSDRLCSKAETADREAKDAERKSEERRRFLKGKDGIVTVNDTVPVGNTAVIRQNVKARIAQVRAILPQLRQGAASANRDKGVVPGFSQYFVQMENNINRLLQAVDTCLDAPGNCSIPPLSCPSPPAMPVFHNVGSANLLRQVQQSYAQAANMAHESCLNLNNNVLGEVEHLKRESRTPVLKAGPGAIQAQQFEDADLYLRRADSLRSEAAQYRQEADRVSGVRGYCSSHTRTGLGADTAHALVAAFKSGTKQEKKSGPDFPPGATVIDLKAGWGGTWNKGKALGSDVPLPKLSGDVGAETTTAGIGDVQDEDGPSWRDTAMSPYLKAKSLYHEADEQVELTKFITSRPKELLKDGVTKLIEFNLGSFGESLTTGYKILSAVKTTSDEVGEILGDAPRVIASGSAADAQELAGRAERVPLVFLNELFDDVTGKFPPPRYKYRYKENSGQ